MEKAFKYLNRKKIAKKVKEKKEVEKTTLEED